MKKKSTERAGTLSPTWETLEAFARQGMQQFLQRMLEAEVDELLARARYERHGPVDAPGGYRNGFGKPRRLSLSNGTIVLRRPRVRGLAERFESRLLPAFKCRTEEGGRLLPEQYLHGLAQGDFDRALRGLLGDGAPLSAPSIARLKAGWQAEYELWKTPGGCRPRGRLPLGGRGVREGRTREGQGGDARGPGGIARRAEGNPRVREWLSGIDRGLGHDPARPQAAWVARPRLVIGDGHLGIWGALGAVFPEAKEQRCWNHRLLNILDKLPLKRQAEARTAAAKRFKKVETRRRSSGRRCSSRRRRSGGSTHPSCWPTSPTTSSTSTACVR